jgi:hypothetical protein
MIQKMFSKKGYVIGLDLMTLHYVYLLYLELIIYDDSSFLFLHI